MVRTFSAGTVEVVAVDDGNGGSGGRGGNEGEGEGGGGGGGGNSGREGGGLAGDILAGILLLMSHE
ncbi:hypothetical protein E2C01_092990 [Portunus trituberculatus]|uniref:Uncharacterized protein n=1 Tax=Portunus trituberculatus TaxID=210409 RepID=A0A5B7JTQ0_PORTR|nr:hypothetical protein [Portunus trituberculatus]